MEENNQNSNGYTGEYGNPVERGPEPEVIETQNAEASENQSQIEESGQEVSQEDSTYGYSYVNHPNEATRSGDYHAEDHAQANVQADAQDRDMHRDSNPYKQNGWSQGPTPNPKPPVTQDKSGGLTGKKVLTCAALAIIFGVIAAVCFKGILYFSDRVLDKNLMAENTQIGYTTDGVKYSSAVTSSAITTSDVSPIAEASMPSIVAITSTEEGENYYDLFGQYYQGQDTSSCGSGFIVGKNDKELLIATNNHVVEGAKTISVQFIDEQVYEATAKGTDASADLAVVAVKLTDIKASTLKEIKIAKLGDSSEAKVGEMVVAIGNALGYGQSVTVGYISAKDREITESSENNQNNSANSGNKIKVIQTDAAINPGNSGGALMNMQGEVIGINSAKIASSSVEGIGYAIPISEATPIIDELMNKEVLTEEQKGYLGISGKTVTEEATSFNMPTGVYVSELAKGGAAEEAGIQKGDIITGINDIKVTTIESLKEKANSYKKGTTVTITLQRNSDGEYQEKKIKVKLQGQSSLNSLPDATASTGGNNDSGNNSGNNPNGNNGDSGENGDSGNSFPFGFGN